MSENGGHVANCGSKNNKKLFPQKLWDLINDERYNFCLRWSEDGQLVYLNRDEFENSYLKTAENQFHTQKAISFVRQMNMYGFRKVDDCYYENDNFKRGCEHLLKNMIRKHPNKSTSLAANTNDITSVLHNHHLHHHLHNQHGNYNNHTSNHNNNNHHQFRSIQHHQGTLLQRRHHHHHQHQHQLHQHQHQQSNSSSPEATAAAAVVASALAQHQQQQNSTSNTPITTRSSIISVSAATRADSNNSMQSDCRQRLTSAYNPLAAAAAAASFGRANQTTTKLTNGDIEVTTAAAESILTTSTTTTTTTPTTTSSANPVENYANQLQESLMAQFRQQQQQQSILNVDDERYHALNDDSLSSMSDFCFPPSGSQPTNGGEQLVMNGVLENSTPTSLPNHQQQDTQQRCNNEALGFTADLKQTQLQLQELRQRQTQAQQQQQHAQLAAQYTNLYPHGLDPILLEQFRALQAAGQLDNVASQTLANSQQTINTHQPRASPNVSPATLAPSPLAALNSTNASNGSPSSNGLGLGLDTINFLSNAAANNNGAQAALLGPTTAMTAHQLQPANLQNNLLLNTLIALGILSITSLTQRG